MCHSPLVFAIVSFLAIPAVLLLGVIAHQAIDPELARGATNYVQQYALIERFRHLVLMTSVGIAVALWLLSFWFLLLAWQRPRWWLPLALLGPLGFVLLALLGCGADAGRDRDPWFRRLVREAVLFGGIVAFAHLAVYAKNALWVRWTAASRGVAVEVIVAEQAASSGMWAFGEVLQIVFLIGLCYLLRPLRGRKGRQKA